MLFQFGIVDVPTCDQCNNNMIDDLEHRFWRCVKTREIWSYIVDWHNNKSNQIITIIMIMSLQIIMEIFY